MPASMSVNTALAAIAAARAGGGLSVQPDFLVADDLRAGRLVHILPDWALPSGGIHAVYPAARFRPAKVTAFVAMLAERDKQRAARPRRRSGA
jgi:DNA-binding transcriptional LysR family regulator